SAPPARRRAAAVFYAPAAEPQRLASPGMAAARIVEDPAIPAKDCPECGRSMILKEDRFGRFWSCSGFPACRHSQSFEKAKEQEVPCPLCGTGQILRKRTPAGRTFFVCSQSSCDLMAWSRPHGEPCQLCGSPYLVEKATVDGRVVLRCPRAGCRYQQPLPGEDGLDLVTGAGLAPGSADAAAPAKVRRLVRRVSGSGGGGKKRRVVVRRKS
ncbi:MAG: type I DNA topoisomerase, partial [Thermodesulfobacteriota bacterium]